jgi:AmmeMemoRadiSam system protein B
MTKLPRLRTLEVLHVPEEQGVSYVLRDPEGYTDDELILSEPALFVAAHCDGDHDRGQLREAFEERYGKPPKPEEVQMLLDRLERAGMLETQAFEERRRSSHEAFLRAPSRPAAHAGTSYPADPEEARRAVRGFEERAAKLEEPGERPSGTLRGVVAPHIDLRVGGPCTALAYRLLSEAPAVDTVVVLGTSHACSRPAWIVLDKPFETPLGPVPVDEEACRRLGGADPAAPDDLYFHRREHSVEFQVLFLAALRERGRDIRMVPILCGSLRDPASPTADGTGFLAALRELLGERGERAVVVAGADLAHVGPRFGDPGVLNPEGLNYLEKEDRETLARVTAGDPAGFYASVMADGDPRRICGLSPVYGLLSVLDGVSGKVLRYEQANDDTGTVTYASVGLWG